MPRDARRLRPSTTPAGRCGQSGSARVPPGSIRSAPDLWGTLAILDYGPEPFVFEERRRVPLGANMAVRRSLIDRDRRLRSRAGPQGRLAAGPGAGGVLLPLARGRRARPVRAGDGAPSSRAGEAAHEGLLPPLVVLEGRLEGAARAAPSDHRARRRSAAGSDRGRRAALHGRARRFATPRDGWAPALEERRRADAPRGRGSAISPAISRRARPQKWKMQTRERPTAEKKFPPRRQHRPYISDNLTRSSDLRRLDVSWHFAGRLSRA